MILDGIDLGLYATRADKTLTLVGSRERGQRGRLFSNEVAEVEDEEIDLLPLDPSIARKLQMALKGDGETWFYRVLTTTTGSRGTVPNSGSYTMTSANGPHSNARCEVASGSFIELPTGSIGQGPWTVRVYRYETIADDGAAADAWYRYVVRGSATSISSWYRNGTLSGLGSPANWLAMASDGDLRLNGKDVDNTNNAKFYSELQVVPYQIESAWASDMDTEMETNAPAGLPWMNLTDQNDTDFEPANTTTPIVVSGRAMAIPRMKWGGNYRRIIRATLQHRTALL